MQHLVRSVLFVLVVFTALPLVAQEPESHFFTASDGHRIHYLTMGDEGSWVLLLHGYTDSARRMWFSTGIAQALAENHRVVAIDHLNHGESDRPEPDPRGVGRISDVEELWELLGIERAHIHGYSMGGAMVSTLLYEHPDWFVTAGFGGSGIRETDPLLRELAASFDEEDAEAPMTIAEAVLTEQAVSSSGAVAGSGSGGGLSSFARPLDLATVKVPVLAVNGELDAAYGKSLRLWRELEIFQNVMLPGLTHFTAIAVGAPPSERYVQAIKGFIAAYDER